MDKKITYITILLCNKFQACCSAEKVFTKAFIVSSHLAESTLHTNQLKEKSTERVTPQSAKEQDIDLHGD